MKKIILETGPSPNSRGLFSFVNQFIAAHRNYYENDNVYIEFDLHSKSEYHDAGIEFTDNVWEYYFKKENEPEQILSEERTVWTDAGNCYGYSFDVSNQEERKIAAEIISKKLILRDELSEEIEKFFSENLKGKRVIGIHKRGTDIGQHHKAKLLDEYFGEVDRIKNDYDLIFISTEERSVVDAFKSRYENVINYSYESLSTAHDKPNFKSKTVGGYKTGKDALIDAYILSKCDFMIQTNSNLSNFSFLANPNLNFTRI